MFIKKIPINNLILLPDPSLMQGPSKAHGAASFQEGFLSCLIRLENLKWRNRLNEQGNVPSNFFKSP